MLTSDKQQEAFFIVEVQVPDSVIGEDDGCDTCRHCHMLRQKQMLNMRLKTQQKPLNVCEEDGS